MGRPRCTKEEWVRKACKKHGDKYDYSKVEYITSHSKVCIIWTDDGDFWQEAGNPKIYHPIEINRVNKKTMSYLFKRTLRKELILKKLGYNYVCIWEHEWNKAVKALTALQRKWREKH